MLAFKLIHWPQNFWPLKMEAVKISKITIAYDYDANPYSTYFLLSKEYQSFAKKNPTCCTVFYKLHWCFLAPRVSRQITSAQMYFWAKYKPNLL